jgi:hypothetical protein
MRLSTLTVSVAAVCAITVPAFAGPASGTVTSPTGTIAPKQAIAYVVRDMRNARNTRIEIMLTDVAVKADGLQNDLDPHVTAINFEELRDRDYVLLWIAAPNTVSMNATYSKTMTQYLNDTSGGLKAELTTNTATRVEGRVFSPSPLKTFDGTTYTVDLKFSADVIPGLTGTPLPAGGGDPARALTTFLAAVKAKNWTGIKAGLSPKALPMYDKSYNTPQENADSAADIFSARLPMDKLAVTRGQLINPTTAVLEAEGERFGSRNLSLVKMVKTGAVWQFEESAPLGTVR